ncbi:synembryn-A [Lates japonicus]|uniref:Synembryn-A n=1 Tax=Lates japonicus TaxID=270547 RepID=A0AAD3MP88_LATJO|nr:synembryn-A [Lates japonicus]
MDVDVEGIIQCIKQGDENGVQIQLQEFNKEYAQCFFFDAEERERQKLSHQPATLASACFLYFHLGGMDVDVEGIIQCIKQGDENGVQIQLQEFNKEARHRRGPIHSSSLPAMTYR